MILVILFCCLHFGPNEQFRPKNQEAFSVAGPSFKNSDWQLRGTFNWLRRAVSDQGGKGVFESKGWEFRGLSAFSDATLASSIDAKQVVNGAFTLKQATMYYVRVKGTSVKENDKVEWDFSDGKIICDAITAKLDFEIYYDKQKSFTFNVDLTDGKVNKLSPGAGMTQKLVATGFFKVIVGDVKGKNYSVNYGQIGGQTLGDTAHEEFGHRRNTKERHERQLGIGGHEIEWCRGDIMERAFHESRKEMFVPPGDTVMSVVPELK